ncbi:MAG: hypothetical protein JST07_00860 [Bacteroidetes bacterium]|nr:hypothetical protein [Bacteroidota bacterium]
MPTLIVNGDIRNSRSSFAGAKDTGTGLDIPVFLLASFIKTAIQRKTDYNIHLFVDNIEVASFAITDRVEIPITGGTHTIKATYKMLQTNEYSFDIGEGEFAEKIFSVDNVSFKEKNNIILTLSFVYFFLLIFIGISFFSKYLTGFLLLLFLMVPLITVSFFYYFSYKKKNIIDITEMWSYYG